MRQRNDTGYERHVSVWPTEEHPDWWPFSVAAGEEKDFPVLIGGFTVIDEEPVKSRRKDAAAAADKKEGEPQ